MGNYLLNPFSRISGFFLVGLLLLLSFLGLSSIEVFAAERGPNLAALESHLNTNENEKIDVKGKVTDSNGDALVGVTVQIKGSSTGTTTDLNGDFQLEAEETDVLVFSYVGFTDVEEEVGSRTTINVIMTTSSMDLNEVVVVGYGTVKKKDLTGSISSISNKNFNKGVNTNPEQLIQGKISGVRVVNNTGQPGGSTTIRIRGNSSIRAGNDPLFVLDGVPLSGNSARPGAIGGFGTDSGNPLDYLNPEDIESIDVLKDASATAIYGSRGANGVVMINTKKGAAGDPSIQVASSIGVSSLLRKPEVLSAGQFREALKDYTPNDVSSADFGDDVDAFKEITRKALTQNHSLGVTGGNDRGHYRLSLGYMNQDGILKGSNLTKYTANLSSSYKFLKNERLSIAVDLFYTQTNEALSAINTAAGAEGNLISQALNWNPTRPMKDDNGDFTRISPNVINPLATIQAFDDHARVNTFLANISPAYKLTDWLEYKLTYSVTRQSGLRQGMYDRLLIDPSNSDKGSAFVGNNNNTDQQVTQTLTFDKDLSDDFHLNAVAGYEFLSFDERSNFVSATGFENRGLKFYDYLQYSPISSRNISSNRTPTNYLKSQFLRVSLNYLSRYLLTATVRRDGSTKFGRDHKYAYFPSLALGWNLSNEEFFNSSTIDNLKLRLGYGQTGNSEFPSGASRNRFIFGNQSIQQTNFGNPDLKWENSTTYNVGIDFALFDYRLSGSIDAFRKLSENTLFERTIAQPAPSGKIWVNLDGSVVNKGVEIELSGDLIRNADWNWNITANYTALDNNVEGLPGFYETAELRGQGFTGVVGQRMISGHPLNTWYLADFQGIDPSSGLSMYRSAEDGHVGTDVDPAQNKFYIHDANPKTILGISTSISYKRLSATINMNGAFGQYLFNNTVATGLALSNLPSRNIADIYFKPDLNESLSNSASPSTRYLEKGDYLKLANATINYQLGDVGSIFKNASIYITGQNLFVFTKYKGFDPEVNTNGDKDGIPSLGIEYIPYPSSRTLLFGIRFSL